MIEKPFEEIRAENFPNLVKEKITQVQEAERVPIKMIPKTPTPRHIIIKITKDKYKEGILKAARERQLVMYEEASIRLSAYFSTETLQARRVWHDAFKVIKNKNMQPRLLYPIRKSFKIES